MAEEDLIAALRNALERGETLEDAKKSLLNAGYKREEVEKAAKVIEELRVKKEFIPKPKFKPLPPPSP
ncbi:MAG: hypothetical protein IB618_02135 [Candidatus Pacearchaeota archaeon]|nr:MAG: hypothetical protein IB618_02135 [Candidatus Pacearchaeota archaeon]